MAEGGCWEDFCIICALGEIRKRAKRREGKTNMQRFFCVERAEEKTENGGLQKCATVHKAQRGYRQNITWREARARSNDQPREYRA